MSGLLSHFKNSPLPNETVKIKDQVLQTTIQLRRDYYFQYGTRYGCDEDPTIRFIKGHKEKRDNQDLNKLKDTSEFLNKNQKSTAADNTDTVSPSTNDVKENPDSDHKDMQSNLEISTDSQNSVKKESILKSHRILPIPQTPYRLALLFIVTKELRFPKLWDTWLQHANDWSFELYKNRKGPYKNIKNDELFIPLFSLHTHFMDGLGAEDKLVAEGENAEKRRSE